MYKRQTLTLADGSTYAYKGYVDQVDRSVSDSTGTLTLKALFQNPDHLLLPGMFANVSCLLYTSCFTTTNPALRIPRISVSTALPVGWPLLGIKSDLASGAIHRITLPKRHNNKKGRDGTQKGTVFLLCFKVIGNGIKSLFYK